MQGSHHGSAPVPVGRADTSRFESKGGAGFRSAAFILSFLLACLGGPALAAPVTVDPALLDPAAEAANREFLRQQERDRQLRQIHEPQPDVRLQPALPAAGTGIPREESPCFRIEHIRLAGDESDRFQWALAQAGETGDGSVDLNLPQCLGATGINQIMRRVQNAIVARGFVTTRVLAQPQDLNAGQLELTLIPGRIHRIRMAPGADPDVTFWNSVPARAGDLLNLRDLEQALENFKRVPTATAGIQIVPAEGQDVRPGDSDLVIDWQQQTPLRLTLSVDDGGSDSTGKYQGSITASADHWLRLNDLFYASFQQDLGGGEDGERGSRGHSLHYSMPVGYWLLALSTSVNDYHQSVAGANQTYVYSGESDNSQLKVSRLMYRDAVRKTTVGLSGWTRASRNFIDDTEVQVQRRQMAGWELDASHREFIGQSALDLNIAYRRGTGAQDSLQAPEEYFDEGTSRPEIIVADTRFSLPFALADQSLRFSSLWRAQWNQTPLVPQDRFSIGGRYTVRGFDGESVLSAARGWLVRNDLGWQPGQWGQQWGQELYIGADYGEVSGQGQEWLLGTRLSGAVLGLRGSYRWFSYDIFAGGPIDKPDGFETASTTSGFTISASF